jgi:hypothetical protein
VLSIWLILFTIRLAVNAILLEPFSVLGISSIDVVAHHSFSAAISDGTLSPEPIRFPVIIERHVTGHAHCVDASARCLQVFPAHADQPIAVAGGPPNHWHAASERTNSVKRIGGKAKVIPHDVDVDLRHSVLTARHGSLVDRLPLSAARVLERRIRTFNRVDDAV